MTSSDDKKVLLSIVDNAIEAGAKQKSICDLLSIPVRTIERWRKSLEDKRSYRIYNPSNKLKEEEKAKIIEICCSKRFIDKSPKEIVPILAEEGLYIGSESTFYRILREAKMIHHRGNTRAPVKRLKVKELRATGPNQVWSWDITYLKTDIKGQFYYLYIFMDVWSRKIVAWDVYEEQTGSNAREVLLKINSNIDLRNIHLHSDNGSPMKCATFLATLQWLGVTPSFSRPRCSNDNPYSESLFKTLKYKAGYPKQFKDITKAKEWLLRFVNWYNKEHRHSGINYVTPDQRHNGLDKGLLLKRKDTYIRAQKKNPERWVKNKVRNWDWDDVEILNPEKEMKNKKRQIA